MLQHVIVLTLVAGCLAYIGRGVFRTLAGAKRTQFGKCCSTGCSATNEPTQKRNEPTERIVFLPVESLKRRRS